MEAAFFDLDKTVISRSSVFAVGLPIYREGMLNRRLLLTGIYRQVLYSLFGADEASMDRAREDMLRVTEGWDQAKVVSIVEDVLESVIGPIVYAEALEAIAEHRQAGRRLYIVSSSPEEIVAPLGRFVGVDEVVATRAEVRDGVYTGRLDFYCYGESKADRIAQIAASEGIDLARSWAYSDSVTDVPMLSAVGNPVAVNADRRLRREARSRGWPVARWSARCWSGAGSRPRRRARRWVWASPRRSGPRSRQGSGGCGGRGATGSPASSICSCAPACCRRGPRQCR